MVICPPLGEELMIDRVLAGQVGPSFGPEEVAELGASGDDLAELEIDGVGHDDGLFLHDFGEAEEVPDGDPVETCELAGAMAHEPCDDGSGVLFVLDVCIEEGGRDAPSAGGG